MFFALNEYIRNKSGYVVFISYVGVILGLIFLIYILQLKILSIKSNSRFVKLCQIIVKSVYIPFIISLFLQMFSSKDNFLLQYLDEYSISIVDKFKQISFVWLSWLCFAGFINNVEKAMLDKKNGETDKTFINVIVRILKGIAYTVMFIMILRLFGVRVGKIIESKGGSTAIITGAFALIYKSQLSNILSGFLILLNKPFKIGNKVILPEKNLSGKILNIGLNKTKMLTYDQQIIVLPNSYFSGAPLINKSECKNSLVNVRIYLEYQDYNKLNILSQRITEELMKNSNIDKSLPINVYSNEINENAAIVLNIECFTNTVDANKIKAIQQFILMLGLDICIKNGYHIFAQK